MDIRIQAIPTWQCNYYDHKKGGPHGSKCAYCNLYSVGNKDTHLQLGFQTTKTLPIIHELTPEQWAKVEKFGLDWLRALINRARPK